MTSSDFDSLSPIRRINFDHYRKYSDQPWVIVDFRYAPLGEAATQTPVLVTVDSGSAVTYLPKVVADRLHIPLRRDSVISKPGAGGMKFRCYASLWDLHAYLCGDWIPVQARFFADDVRGGALLGRQGAFDSLQIAFVHGQRLMYATRVSR